VIAQQHAQDGAVLEVFPVRRQNRPGIRVALHGRPFLSCHAPGRRQPARGHFTLSVTTLPAEPDGGSQALPAP
jgi:hypothetical protein